MTWTTVTDAQLAVNKPARSADIKAIRDNITALANGDSGAPQVQTAAIADASVTPAKLSTGVVPSVFGVDSGAGTWLLNQMQVASVNVPSSGWTKMLECVCQVSGTYNTRLTFYQAISGYTHSVRIYKNGVAYGTLRTTGTPVATYEWLENNIVFASGDTVEVYAIYNRSGFTSTGSTVTLRTGGVYSDAALNCFSTVTPSGGVL